MLRRFRKGLTESVTRALHESRMELEDITRFVVPPCGPHPVGA